MREITKIRPLKVRFQLRNCNFSENHTKSCASCSDSRELRALAREKFFSIEEKKKIILHTVYSNFPSFRPTYTDTVGSF